MSFTTFPTVQAIIDGVSQDIRTQLSSVTNSVGQPILVDYTNRTHKQMLRFSRWRFLKSEPQYFLTQFGQSVYWIGPKGQGPPGSVDTGLNLLDCDKIRKGSVVDLANQRSLKWLTDYPIGPNLLSRTGEGVPGLPAVWGQNPNDPNVFFLYPPPNNQNNTQPGPQAPVVNVVPGGTLPARIYLCKVTIVDQLGGEGTATTIGTPVYIPANFLVQVKSPSTGIFGQLPVGNSVSGLSYNRYNVYIVQATLVNGVATNEGSETLQNGMSGPISIGTDWTEPTTGLITTGASTPRTNTLQLLGAYPIKFDYFKGRITLTKNSQSLQIPDDYQDIVIQGVSYLAWRLLGKQLQATESRQAFRQGLTEMVWDKNQFPEDVEFIRPDASSYINTQILGYLDPFFVSFIPVSYLQWIILEGMWHSLLERVKIAVKLIHTRLERKSYTISDSFVRIVGKLNKKLFELLTLK